MLLSNGSQLELEVCASNDNTNFIQRANLINLVFRKNGEIKMFLLIILDIVFSQTFFILQNTISLSQ